MLTREEVRKLALESKDKLGLTWPQLGKAISRDPVYAALLVYGYGQATTEEGEALVRTLALPKEALATLKKAPHRAPAQPWPPTDPFIYPASTKLFCSTALPSRMWPTSYSATAS